MQLTSKGQVTIPKKIRDKYGFHAGVEVDFVDEGDVLRVVKFSRRGSPLDSIYGLLKRGKKAVPYTSTDEWIEGLRGR